MKERAPPPAPQSSYIKENFSEQPSLQNLAKQIGYSYNYLSGNFKKIFHTNFSRLVNEYRIGKAQTLLADTSDTVLSIAAACGYDSPQSLNRNFLLVTGMTPTEYRAKREALRKIN